MQKLAFSLLLCCFTLQSYAKVEPLKGFHYASEQAPKGNEWESPENLALNKEQPHAYFFSFQDKASARKVLPENSAYWQSLMSLDGIIFRFLQAGIFMVSKKTEHKSTELLFM